MGMPADNKEPDYYTDMPVGDILRRAREHYGQSLQQVEVNLRIRAEQLDAIERGELDRLPGKAYAIGFVRSYSEYLGFDRDKMVQLLKKQSLRGKVEPELHFPIAASDSKLPSTLLSLGGVVFVVVCILVWIYVQPSSNLQIEEVSSQQSNVSLADNTNQVNSSARVYNEPIGPKITEDQRAAVERKKGILLSVKENSWVQIKDGEGKTLVSRVLNAGESYIVPDRPDLRMSLGNAGGVVVSVGGKQLPAFGRRAQVVRNISLDAKALKELAQTR